MPTLESHSYIIEWLFDIGPMMYSSMGSSPISYQEIESWRDGIELSHWEKSTLKGLSAEYMNWLQKGAKKDCPVPYSALVMTPEKQTKISNSLSDFFTRLASKPSQGLGAVK